jgi:hypothetical protein
LYSTNTSRLFRRKSRYLTLEVNVLTREVKLVGVRNDVVDLLGDGGIVLVSAVESRAVPEKVVDLLFELYGLVNNFQLALFRETDEHVEDRLEVIVEESDEHFQVVEDVTQNIQNERRDFTGLVLTLQTAILLSQVAEHKGENDLGDARADQLIYLAHQILQ